MYFFLYEFYKTNSCKMQNHLLNGLANTSIKNIMRRLTMMISQLREKYSIVLI